MVIDISPSYLYNCVVKEDSYLMKSKISIDLKMKQLSERARLLVKFICRP